MRKSLQQGVVGASLAALMMGAGALPASAQREYSRTTNRDSTFRGNTVPANTIIRAELDQDVRSSDARRGDRVTARIDDEDTSSFPQGTRFEGTITEVQRARDDRPASLDMVFDRAILPGGSTVAIRGELASLSEEDVRRGNDGRLESRRRSGGGSSFDWKWVGYGAAGGAVLGQVFGGNLLRGGLLGGLGGAIYGYLNRDKDGRRDDYRDLELTRGTPFGMRLDQSVALNRRPDWRYGRASDRVAGAREDYRLDGDTRVFLDGQPVNFGTDRPTTFNGVAYVPLRPIANAAGWRLNHRGGADSFSLTTDSGTIRSYMEDAYVNRGGQRFTLTDTPRLVNDEIYVPLEWLTVAAETAVEWNRSGRRVDLTTTGRSLERDEEFSR